MVCHGHAAHQGLNGQNISRRQELLNGGGDAARRAVENGGERFGRRQGHVELEQKAVDLGFGQNVGAVHFERVLRGQDEEGLW